MCLVFLVFGCNPPQPRLFLAFNRDEFFQRPTQPLHIWEDGSGLLAGRDLGSGGTWLGINTRNSRVALLTNLRSCDPIEPSSVHSSSRKCTSRGELVTGFLSGISSPREYVQSIPHNRYHGFNLIVGDIKTVADPRVGDFVYTNNSSEPNGAACGKPGCCANKQYDGGSGHSGGAGRSSPTDAIMAMEQLEPGRVYGLSNGRIMEWPKVASGTHVLWEMLPGVCKGKEVPYDRIFDELLGDSRRLVPPREMAPSVAPDAGVGGRQGGATEAVAVASTVARHPGETATAVHAEPVDTRRRSQEAAAAVASAMPGNAGDLKGVGDGTVPVSGGAAAAAWTAVEKFDVQTFQERLDHITSGRFVKAVESPYGMYGTRSQTVVVIWHDGSGEARERHRGDDGTWSEVTIPFQLGVMDL